MALLHLLAIDARDGFLRAVYGLLDVGLGAILATLVAWLRWRSPWRR